jgi:glycosyltransferase involved in cell wall biosynthesis
VIIVNYAYNRELFSPKDLLHNYFGLVGWVNGLFAAGIQATVFQRFRYDDKIMINGADYHFISDHSSSTINRFQIPLKLHKSINNLIRELGLDKEEIILHINGLVFPLQTLHLQFSIHGRYGVVVQHHAENPKSGIGRIAQWIGLRSVDGFMFSTQEHVIDWRRAGIIHSKHLVGEIMETSSILEYEERTKARKRTGLLGAPILIWTGNLNHNKDPITILEGLEMILQAEPNTRLYMAYRYDDLLTEVREYICSNKNLREAVYLLGCIPYSEISPYYNSADFFVQGSHKEGSGIALLDALACGVIPVVTDIPSFRVITDNGRIGALWPAGDSKAFADALLSVINRPIDQQSLDARVRFEESFSFDKLGNRAADYYHRVIKHKSHQENI